MALGTQTTTFLRGTICGLTGLLLLAALASHWHLLALVFGGYWLARGGLAIYGAYLKPARVASMGLVAVLSLVSGVLIVQASPVMAGTGIGLALALFVGFQALITGAIDISEGIYDGRFSSCGFGLVAICMGTGLWFIPLFGFETAVAMMGLVAFSAGLGAMAWIKPRRRPRVRHLLSS